MWIFFYQAYENEINHFIADQSLLEIIDLVDYLNAFATMCATKAGPGAPLLAWPM